MKPIKRFAKPFTFLYSILRKAMRLFFTGIKAMKHVWYMRTKIRALKRDKSTLHDSLSSLKPIIHEIDRVLSSPELLHDQLSSVISKIHHTAQETVNDMKSKPIDHQFQTITNQLHSILNENFKDNSNKKNRIIDLTPVNQTSFTNANQLNHVNHDLDDLSLDNHANSKPNTTTDELS